MSDTETTGAHPARSSRWRLLGLTGVGIAVAVVVAGWSLLQQDESPPPAGLVGEDEEFPEDLPELPADITYGERQDVIPPMVQINAESAVDLDAAFQQFDYDWPPDDTVPAVAVGAFPPLGELSVDERKSLFFRTLLPLVVAENQIMLKTRDAIAEAYADGAVEADSREERLLQTLAGRFRVEGEVNDPAFRKELLRRVDAIPVSMALAQAANESGWGQSRFAREANNIFGVWTWQEELGMVPEQRAAGATHFVRVFPDLRASVRNYLYTINAGSAYDHLRTLREKQRERNQSLSGLELAAGLERYSERGEAYVEEIQGMIRGNDLHEIGGPELTAIDARELLEDPVDVLE